MQTALGKDSHAHGSQVHHLGLHSVLANHPSRRVARDGSDQVGRTWVKMRRQHAAGSELQERNADARVGEGGEGSGIGSDDGTRRAVVIRVRVKVVPPVRVLVEKSLLVEVGSRRLDLCVESGVDGARLGYIRRNDEREYGGEEED